MQCTTVFPFLASSINCVNETSCSPNSFEKPAINATMALFGLKLSRDLYCNFERTSCDLLEWIKKMGFSKLSYEISAYLGAPGEGRLIVPKSLLSSL